MIDGLASARRNIRLHFFPRVHLEALGQCYHSTKNLVKTPSVTLLTGHIRHIKQLTLCLFVSNLWCARVNKTELSQNLFNILSLFTDLFPSMAFSLCLSLVSRNENHFLSKLTTEKTLVLMMRQYQSKVYFYTFGQVPLRHKHSRVCHYGCPRVLPCEQLLRLIGPFVSQSRTEVTSSRLFAKLWNSSLYFGIVPRRIKILIACADTIIKGNQSVGRCLQRNYRGDRYLYKAM